MYNRNLTQHKHAVTKCPSHTEGLHGALALSKANLYHFSNITILIGTLNLTSANKINSNPDKKLVFNLLVIIKVETHYYNRNRYIDG